MSHPDQPQRPNYDHQDYRQYGHDGPSAPYGPAGAPDPYTPGSQPRTPHGQRPPTRGKRHRWPWIVGILVVIFVLMAACIAAGSTSPTSAPGGAPASSAEAPAGESVASDRATVVYEITGSGKASNVTYSADGSASINQETNVRLPWRKEMTVEREFAITSVTAQNGGSGEIACKIIVDGRVVKEGTSSGQFSVVSCTGEPIT